MIKGMQMEFQWIFQIKKTNLLDFLSPTCCVLVFDALPIHLGS
jgi:hypothetical protein